MPPLKPEHTGLKDLRDDGWRGTVSEVGKRTPPREREDPDPRQQPQTDKRSGGQHPTP